MCRTPLSITPCGEAALGQQPRAACPWPRHDKSRHTNVCPVYADLMATREPRPRRFRRAWNLWVITAFALIPVAAAVGLWSAATQVGTVRSVFIDMAYGLLLVATLCAKRGSRTRKLAVAAAPGVTRGT